uniref:Uncharacterized protein n=1 Tax=Anopheles maculatus TaxID=74869 RepID=A0A182TC29_9DIPT
MVMPHQRTASQFGQELLLMVLLLSPYFCGAFSFNTEAPQTVANCNQPPLDVHPKDCCHLPSLIDEDLLRNCKNLYGGEPLQRTLIYERGKCFVECALNATGTLVNGVLDQAKILNNCPQHIWSNTAQCNSLKQYILHCPQPF